MARPLKWGPAPKAPEPPKAEDYRFLTPSQCAVMLNMEPEHFDTLLDRRKVRAVNGKYEREKIISYFQRPDIRERYEAIKTAEMRSGKDARRLRESGICARWRKRSKPRVNTDFNRRDSEGEE